MTIEQTQTKETILKSAIELFAQKGYSNTTIRDICKSANTYQLAINYHFGSKEDLYREVLLATYELTEERGLIDINKNLPCEEQLKRLIEYKLKCIFFNKEKSAFYRIISRESDWGLTNNETFEKIFNLTVKRIYDYLKNILRKISEQKNNEYMINYYAYSVIFQIKGFAQSEFIRKQLFGTETLDLYKVELLAELISNFTIAAIKMKKECN